MQTICIINTATVVNGDESYERKGEKIKEIGKRATNMQIKT